MQETGIAPNAKRLLWAGFTAILAAGVGMAIRGGLLAVWQQKFNFTGLEVGLVNGAGFTGFCFGIVIGGIIADKIGYGKLVVAAFLLHVISAFVTFGAMDGMQTQQAFVYLWSGTFLFAVANGTLEAVANPLVATVFPGNRTHYLNILHASWPAGMVLGALAGTYLGGELNWGWKAQLALFLVPTAVYGLMFMGQKFPRSEASERGLSLGEMFRDVGVMGSAVIGFFIGYFVKDGLGPLLAGFTHSDFFSTPTWTYIAVAVGAAVWLGFSGISRWSMGAGLLFILFVTHALIGAVELGTDGWIQNITGIILTPTEGRVLFIITSAFMLFLRFCGHWIEKNLKLTPVGILFTCAIIACIGLNLVSAITAFGGAVGAVLVYALGKTFFWPTMLAVASDRFPRTGAVAISIMGGIGMMSAGLIGSPGLGYANDRYAGDELNKSNPALYAEYKSSTPSKWLVFEEVHGLDASKVGKISSVPAKERTPDQVAVLEANVRGSRRTLRADSFIPATMAVIFLGLILYFKSIGGYKVLTIKTEDELTATTADAPVR
jgi:MFS family permease